MESTGRRAFCRSVARPVLVAVGEVGDAAVDAFAASGRHVVALVFLARLGRVHSFLALGVGRGIRGFLVSHLLLSCQSAARAAPMPLATLTYPRSGVSLLAPDELRRALLAEGGDAL